VNAEFVAAHMGQLHAYEQALVVLLAFGPVLLLAVTIRIARRRAEAEENEQVQAEEHEPVERS
jgi:hypothetical protein